MPLSAHWWYGNKFRSAFFYGRTESYRLGARWLQECELVEDWGCGLGAFTFYRGRPIRGIDGSPGPCTDTVADLCEYVSDVPGIFMRAVLEHNYDWRKILGNACRSFTGRMVLVLFTPLADETHQIAWVEEYGVPDLAFRLEDLTDIMDEHDIEYRHETVETAPGIRDETIFYMRKP